VDKERNVFPDNGFFTQVKNFVVRWHSQRG
jgi:hypothetical protein